MLVDTLHFWVTKLKILQERDNMQKSEFLKALSDMWKDFDSRVLRYKVWVISCLFRDKFLVLLAYVVSLLNAQTILVYDFRT